MDPRDGSSCPTPAWITRRGGWCARQAKPFNPILGETFDFVRPEFRFLSEQVAHSCAKCHPTLHRLAENAAHSCRSVAGFPLATLISRP